MGPGAGNTYAFPTSITSYVTLNSASPPCNPATSPSSVGSFNAIVQYNYYIGKPTITTDINNNSTTYSYNDILDRLTGVSRPDGGSTAYSYTDWCTKLPCPTAPAYSTVTSQVAQSSAGAITTNVFYDGLARKTASVLYEGATLEGPNNPNGPWIAATTAYDGKNRPCYASLPYPQSGMPPPWSGAPPSATCTSSGGTQTNYDGADRPVEVIEADGSTSLFSYVDNTVLSIDPACVSKETASDRFGRLINLWENHTSWSGSFAASNGCATGNSSQPTYITSYSYDGMDDLIGVNQSSQNRTFTYDTLKRLVQAQNPESGTISYSYDYSNNLATRTDPVRTLTFGAYDGMNRVQSKSYSDGTATVSYTYDGPCNGLGRLATVTAGSIINSYSCYDPMGRISASSQQFGSTSYTFGYTYDISGALATETYPSLRTITNAFDPAGRITAATGTTPSSSATYASVTQYAPQGAIQAMNFNGGSGVSENWVFNTRQQPSSLVVTQTNTQPVMQQLNLAWGYGSNAANNGNVLSQNIAGAGLASQVIQSYSYDAFNRLSTFQETGGTPNQNYNYDAFGNRWLTQASSWIAPGMSGQTPVADVFTNNQWGVGGGVTYDGAGNQTAISSPSRLFTYDGENRQITGNIAGSAVTYNYDGEGRRVQKTAASGTTNYVYDAMGQLAAEYGSDSSTAVGRVYLSVDALGSTRLVTDLNGNPIQQYDYAPFGEELTQGIDGRGTPFSTSQSGPDAVTQKFTSKERDSETGLDFFEARYMSSAQGRFTSPDPLGGHLEDPQSFNRYAYARNNPLRFTDPTGLDFSLDCKGESDGCHNGRVGTTANDENGNKVFTATVLNNDKPGSSSLVDQYGSAYSGTFNQSGFHFTDSNGNTTNGEFTGSTATTLTGSGIFGGFTGVFNSNGLGTNIGQGSIFGTPAAFGTLLEGLGSANVGLDAINFFHKGTIQYRGGNENGPDPHLSFNVNQLVDAGGILSQSLHFDGAYPFGDLSGFALHTTSVLKSLFETQILRQKDVKPPQSIPH